MRGCERSGAMPSAASVFHCADTAPIPQSAFPAQSMIAAVRHASARKPTGLDLLDRCRGAAGIHLQLSAHKVGQPWRVAAIRYVKDIDAGHNLEKLDGHLLRGARSPAV